MKKCIGCKLDEELTQFNTKPVCLCKNISKKLCFDCVAANPRTIFAYCFYCFINKFDELDPNYEGSLNDMIGLGISAMKIGKLDRDEGREMVKLSNFRLRNLIFFYNLGYNNPNLNLDDDETYSDE